MPGVGASSGNGRLTSTYLEQMSMALTDAGLFAAYLVALGWGVLVVFEGGDETIGLLMLIVAGGLFVWKMHALFNQGERK